MNDQEKAHSTGMIRVIFQPPTYDYLEHPLAGYEHGIVILASSGGHLHLAIKIFGLLFQ